MTLTMMFPFIEFCERGNAASDTYWWRRHLVCWYLNPRRGSAADWLSDSMLYLSMHAHFIPILTQLPGGDTACFNYPVPRFGQKSTTLIDHFSTTAALLVKSSWDGNSNRFQLNNENVAIFRPKIYMDCLKSRGYFSSKPTKPGSWN